MPFGNQMTELSTVSVLLSLLPNVSCFDTYTLINGYFQLNLDTRGPLTIQGNFPRKVSGPQSIQVKL